MAKKKAQQARHLQRQVVANLVHLELYGALAFVFIDYELYQHLALALPTSSPSASWTPSTTPWTTCTWCLSCDNGIFCSEHHWL